MRTKSFFILSFLTLFAGIVPVIAQTQDYHPSKERAIDGAIERRSVMDANQLRATYYNTGHAGKEANTPDEIQFEYPKNTGRNYMYFVSVMVGTEVPDELNPSKTFPIVDVAAFRTSRIGKRWTLAGVDGYFNPDSKELARSDRGPGNLTTNTWPSYWPDKRENGGDGWPGAWNGYFGKNQFNADLEFYYKATDNLYTKYLDSNVNRFHPDKTDSSRGGLGLFLDVRVLAWTQTLINADHFNIFEVTNGSSYDYNKVGFGLWIADLVAGTASDDQPLFDELRSVAYLTDLTRYPAPPQFDGPIGEMGLKFLETPSNSVDGIDNDGDSDTFNPADATFYDQSHADLFDLLTIQGGGFYSRTVLVDSVIPKFQPQDFQNRTIGPGSKIVLIGQDMSRFVTIYPQGGGKITYNGNTFNLPPGGLSVNEDIFPESDPRSLNNNNQTDDDYDGLIDENTPNDLEKKTAVNFQFVPHPVRFINYLYFQPGDTIQRGFCVSNRLIRQRLKSDPNFKKMIVEDYGGRWLNYNTAAPMIDESRDDYFDNNKNWNPITDDVGIQGDPDTPSQGQGDGLPSSGAGTTYPGEPAIDKTDVQESDMIGVTNVTIAPAGGTNTSLDADLWNKYLVPGTFDTQAPAGKDSDILVASSPFPLKRGATERFSLVITAVQTKSQNRQDDRIADNRNLDQATKAYDANYQFAVAPYSPEVHAVTGDGYVKLYWDESSEQSFDRYLSRITGNGYDFEGYRVYRATDPAFEDAKTVTDASGNPQFYKPLVIYDKVDQYSGYHPIPINGVQYDLGSNSGLRHIYVDSTVTNGKRYFYAVTAFDFGNTTAGIAPSESAIKISQNPDGSVTLGKNVVEVRPSPSQAGYISPENPVPTLLSGSPGGSVSVTVADPAGVNAGDTYDIVFQDTLIKSGYDNIPDTLKTKNFSLINMTKGKQDTLIKESKNFNGEDNPVVEGLHVNVKNTSELKVNTDLSGWHYDEANQTSPPHNYDFSVWKNNAKLADYELIIGNQVGFGMSTDTTVQPVPGSFVHLPAIPTNFKIYNTYDNKEIRYGFADLDNTGGDGKLSASTGNLGLNTDIIVFIEDYLGKKNQFTYRLQLRPILKNGVETTVNPQPGDTLFVRTTKPFSSRDRYEFKIQQQNTAQISDTLAKKQLADIKVVPNPYKVTNPYEPAITTSDNTQHRELHFTHIPVPCILRIFTVSGYLVRQITIEKGNPNLFGGTYKWDMLTKDNLEVSYGVYLYQIHAEGVGDKIGKFAVIK